MERRLFWIALNLVPGLGPVRIKALVNHFGAPERAFEASVRELAKVPKIGPNLAETIKREICFQKAQDELEKAERVGAKVICWDEEGYPEPLRYIHAPPPVLYVKGRLPVFDKAVAIVGTRNPSFHGREVARRMGRDFAQAGCVVVSGLARGVDAEAHKGTLEGGGVPIGVLGCGIDIVYPAENKELFEKVKDAGAIISEFPIGTPPEKGNFPRRNRLISGLAKAVVIVEAGERSGALITADLALEQGKEVFACPGPAGSPKSAGTNRLIKEGAYLADSAEDVFGVMGWGRDNLCREEKILPEMGVDERKVFELLSHEPVHVDELARYTGLTSGKLYTILVKMQMEGLIRELPGKNFVRGEDWL